MPIVEGEREQLNMTATPKNTSEQDPYQYYAEASDLGFPPGKWPHILESEIGNSQPFILHHGDAYGNYVYYQGGSGAILTVFND